MPKTKILFHIINAIFIIFYVYPGSILGYLIYHDFNKQPQVTTDFRFSFIDVSSNHVYALALLSMLGFINYYKSHKYLIIIYFFMISIILEGLHLVIPNRGFQFSDLFGNILSVLLSLLLFNLVNYWKKNEFI